MKVKLEDYSFKDIKVVLIPSLVGRFKDVAMDKVGLGKVRRVMKKNHIKMKNATLTANSTSLGSPN